MKNLLNFVLASKESVLSNGELQKLGLEILKSKDIENLGSGILKVVLTENEKQSIFKRFINPTERVQTPDIDIDIDIDVKPSHSQNFVKYNPVRTDEFLHILKLVQQMSSERQTDVKNEMQGKFLEAVDKVSMIQETVAQNRAYILKTNNIEANRDFAIKYGNVWNEFLIHLNELIDEIELIAIAMNYVSHDDFHHKFNYLFSKENIANLLIKKGIQTQLVKDWLRIK